MSNYLNISFDEVYAIVNSFFKDDEGNNFKLTSYETDIIHSILLKKHPKILCWAATRAGKSMSVAIAIILLAILKKGEKIRIIAPTVNHTNIIMRYVTQHILDHQGITKELTLDYHMPAERLKQELSKKRITFKNGSEIMILTADISGNGRSLLGFGGSTIIVDEAESIPEEIIRTKIMRMLGDTKQPLIFLVSNPTSRGFMFDKQKDPTWKQIRINWEQCVKEGRLSYDFVMERKKELSQPEFDIWYNSVYPEESQDQLIPWGLIERAIEKYPDEKQQNLASIFLGVDVASYGNDFTVFTTVELSDDGKIRILDIQHTEKTSTMETVGRIITLDEKYNYTHIIIDASGLGIGVVDRLKEQDIGKKVSGIFFGEAPVGSDKKRYLNRKAEIFFNLRKLFEDKNIKIPKHHKLIDELTKMRFEFTSNGKIKIIDPEKSPDFADSLAIACQTNYGLGNVILVDTSLL